MSATVYQIVTDLIVESLAKGIVPWKKPWHTTESVPINAISRRPYRGVNVLLLGMQPYTDHRWLTYRQVQGLGGHVRPGQHSTLVVFWKTHDNDDRNARQTHVVPRPAPILRYYHVFNADQCQDLRLPALPEPEPTRVNQRIDRAEALVQSMPDPPTIREGGARAWYRPADDLVQVPPLASFESANSYYATLLHELGHATGHSKRLGREGVIGTAEFGSCTYSREELVAELTSAFCCATVGLDNSLLDNAAAYVAGWMRSIRNDPRAIVVASAQAQRAADHIRNVTYASNDEATRS